MSELIKNMVANRLAGLKSQREGIVNAIEAAKTEIAEQTTRLNTTEQQITECEQYLGGTNEQIGNNHENCSSSSKSPKRNGKRRKGQ